MAGNAAAADASRTARLWRTRRLLRDARAHLGRRILKFAGFLLFAYLVMKVIPGLEKALDDLKEVNPGWVIGALAIETLAQAGYVVSWQGILDPDGILRSGDRGRHLGARVAWAQLGGGMIVPGGSLGSMGVGAWMLHRLGVSSEGVAERQFTLMFLNTGVDALAVVLFGLGLAFGLFSGSDNLVLTLLPAGIVAAALALALFVARRAQRLAARLDPTRPRVASGITALAAAVSNTATMLHNRGSTKIVLGAIAYLGFDMAVLQGALFAVDVRPVPSFAVVSMCYLVGGLAGSIPLPANLAGITGMAVMLIAFGVDSNAAVAAVVLYQAIGFIVPLVGGGIAYLYLRREFRSIGPEASEGQPLLE